MSVPEVVHLLEQVCTRFKQREVAQLLGRNPKTINRWRTGHTPLPPYLRPALQTLLVREPTAPSQQHFTFIDLFAGIGGIRLGFESSGGRCVFTSEWNAFSQKTYRENFIDGHEITGDIVKVNAQEIPDHDVLLAGFPCQPFSIAGVSKKNAWGVPTVSSAPPRAPCFSMWRASLRRSALRHFSWRMSRTCVLTTGATRFGS